MARNKPYTLHPEAQAETDGAYNWYLERSDDATFGFLISVSEALDVVSRNPNRWPEYLYGTRRYLLPTFPFSVVYLEQPETVTIIAVAHHKRRPGYWKTRL